MVHSELRLGRLGRSVTAVVMLGVMLALLVVTGPAAAGPQPGEWVNENYEMTYVSEFPAVLADLERSKRVEVEVVGRSAGGHPLYVAVVTAPWKKGELARYRDLRRVMMTDPARARKMIARDRSFRVPVFINGSMHGGETPGTDAALEIMKRLAWGNDAEVQTILRNTIVVVNVCHNPDGRTTSFRENANGFNPNAGTLGTQPEGLAFAKLMAEWKPLICQDLHGFVGPAGRYGPFLSDPCTKPHNPNHEEDIYLDWSLQGAEAGEARLVASMPVEFPRIVIPYRDFEEAGGWDDYPWHFAPDWAGYFGLYGQSIETGPKDWRGVMAHYHFAWGQTLFAAEHKYEMFDAQLEIYERGTKYGGPHGNKLPYAHIIPVARGLQRDPIMARETVSLLREFDITVKRAQRPFKYGGVTYPKGTFVVPLDQPLSGLANNVLWKGENLNADPLGWSVEAPAWSWPECWGFDRVVAEQPVRAKLVPVAGVRRPIQGRVLRPSERHFAFANDTNNAIVAVNRFLAADMPVVQLTSDHGVQKIGSFVVTAPARVVLKQARKLGLRFTGIKSVPAGVDVLEPVEIAAYTSTYDRVAVPADPGAPWTNPPAPGVNYGSPGSSGLRVIGPAIFGLKALGFDVTVVRKEQIAAGVLDGFDVLFAAEASNLDATGLAEVEEFFEAGGGLIATGRGGAAFAKTLGVISDYQTVSGTGILRVANERGNTITGTYPAGDFVFGAGPAAFVPGDGDEVLASYLVDPLAAGYMLDHIALGGKASALRADDAVLFGNDPGYRGHIKVSWRQVANAALALDD